MTTAAQRTQYLLLAAIVVVALATLAVFWQFTADDAYIYMRYGENLVDTGALVFNQGERMTSMTSPLLALFDALLYALCGATRTAYKIVAVPMWLATLAIVARRLPADPWLRAFAVAVLALSPSVLTWTVGGMETPMLTLLVAATTALALDCDREQPHRTVVTLLLAGIATVCRQDAAPFMAGLSLQALRGQRKSTIARAVAVGLLPPLLWSTFSILYYQDLFPTSFHVKPPTPDLSIVAGNAGYVLECLLYTGALPVAVALLWAARRARRSGGAAPPRGASCVWLGIALQGCYLLLVATVHMTFAFRAIVPYLPALLLAAAWPARAAGLAVRPARQRALAALLVAFVGLQVTQSFVTYSRHIQGFARCGELHRAPLSEFVQIMPVTADVSRAVAAHWQTLPGRPDRPPRIWTWAEGLIPYVYRDAYFFGRLLSYRHHGDPTSADYMAWADYWIVPSRPGAVGDNEVVSRDIHFDGSPLRIVAVHNPNPQPRVLPPTVAGEFAR